MKLAVLTDYAEKAGQAWTFAHPNYFHDCRLKLMQR